MARLCLGRIACKTCGKCDGQPRQNPENSLFHSGNNPMIPVFVEPDSSYVLEPFQTFSLAIGAQGIIQSLLLDRFLACMKPASIT